LFCTPQYMRKKKVDLCGKQPLSVYYEGGDLKKATFYYEAVAGHEVARTNIGTIDLNQVKRSKLLSIG
jgi:hypothetical protein